MDEVRVRFKLTLQQRIFLIKCWWKYEKLSKVTESWNAEYPGEPVPTRRTIYKLRDKFNRIGSVTDAPRSGRPITALTEENKENVATTFVEDPQTSTRRASTRLDISQTSIRRVLHDINFKCYIPRLVQELNEDDPDRRLQFCEIVLNEIENNPIFLQRVIWTDESTFKLNGLVNRHNCVYWGLDNSNIIMPVALNAPGITVWAGISYEGIIGPYFFNDTVTGATYLDMLQNFVWPILQNHPNIEHLLWQQDGAPPHFHHDVTAWLDRNFNQRWIGRRGPTEWPARSPDLSPPDFFMWGHIKNLVYKVKPANLVELRHEILQAFQTIDIGLCQKVCLSVCDRYHKCVAANGKQID